MARLDLGGGLPFTVFPNGTGEPRSFGQWNEIAHPFEIQSTLAVLRLAGPTRGTQPRRPPSIAPQACIEDVAQQRLTRDTRQKAEPAELYLSLSDVPHWFWTHASGQTPSAPVALVNCLIKAIRRSGCCSPAGEIAKSSPFTARPIAMSAPLYRCPRFTRPPVIASLATFATAGRISSARMRAAGVISRPDPLAKKIRCNIDFTPSGLQLRYSLLRRQRFVDI